MKISTKTILLSSMSLLVALPSFASESKYICDRYLDGKSTGGHVKVYAHSKTDAEIVAIRKYRDELDMRVDYVICRDALF